MAMIITELSGKLSDLSLNDKSIDWLYLEWYETRKRILHKTSAGGKQIVLKFLSNSEGFRQGDILLSQENELVVIDIIPCDAITIKPDSLYQMASICYEIGNKHLPLFYEADTLLVPYDEPLFRMLSAAGFNPLKQSKKLMNPLRTSVTPHDSTSGKSLFSRIMNFSNPPS